VRLDHLLSKEHHVIPPPPRLWDQCGRDISAGACSGLPVGA
jgi:hypothetical protein